MPSILPDMTFNEALEITKIHSIAGNLNKNAGIVKQRPFRSPHHSTTVTAMIRGWEKPKTGRN